MKALILNVGGWLCIVTGLAGLVLPLIPGTVLLVTGVMLLAQRYSWARRLLERINKRLPKIRRITQD